MADRRYSKNGEWIAPVGDHWVAGLTRAAAEELGDVTFVEPALAGRSVTAGEAVCALEAVKAAADYYSPVTGTVSGGNPRLTAEPQLVSQDPEGEGWVVRYSALAPGAWEGLLDEAGWKAWEAGR